MFNRLKEFQNFALISSIPEGLLDPDEVGQLALSPDYEQWLDRWMEELKAIADEYKSKLGLWPPDAHGTRMYKQYLAKAEGARIVIEELFELKCAIRDQARKT